MKILLIGPQGSGKSTQAKLLSQFLRLPYISTGDIFREMGGDIKQILDKGQLVDDATTSAIITERLSKADCKEGFVVDGYPRSLEQLRLFDPHFDRVFYLKLKEETVMERLLKRRREDDTEELINKRLELYYEQTQPLLDHYENLGKLVEIEGEGSIEQVYSRIKWEK